MAIAWLRRLFRDDKGPNAERRQGDPRGGTQSDEYRHADPRHVVEEGGTPMSAPGGAPQEGLAPEERRRLDRR
jgi:hypothetical protein